LQKEIKFLLSIILFSLLKFWGRFDGGLTARAVVNATSINNRPAPLHHVPDSPYSRRSERTDDIDDILVRIDITDVQGFRAKIAISRPKLSLHRPETFVTVEFAAPECAEAFEDVAPLSARKHGLVSRLI
jgi:hypothetical protein